MEIQIWVGEEAEGPESARPEAVRKIAQAMI